MGTMRSMAAFLWMMLVLKIPLIALLWLVWWSVREVPTDEEHIDEGGGGGGGSPHPRPRRPRPPRRGPHAGQPPGSPSRVRVQPRRRQRVPAARH